MLLGILTLLIEQTTEKHFSFSTPNLSVYIDIKSKSQSNGGCLISERVYVFPIGYGFRGVEVEGNPTDILKRELMRVINETPAKYAAERSLLLQKLKQC